MRCVATILFLQFGLLSFSSVLATNIILDYSHDSATDNFFGRNPVAKAAVDQAAADLSEFLASSLTPIEAGQDPTIGTYLDSSVSIDMHLNYENPSTGQSVLIENPIFDADEVRIFVGMTEINSATLPGGGDVAGLGSTGSVGLSIGAGGALDQFGPAITSAEQMANQLFRRGSTPITQHSHASTVENV